MITPQTYIQVYHQNMDVVAKWSKISHDITESITNSGVVAQIIYYIIQGEPERAPNTRETGSGIYIILYIPLD